MEQNPFKNEASEVTYRMANPEDWEALKKIRLDAITGEDSEMFGPLGIARDIKKNDEEWKAELMPGNKYLFYMLAFSGSEVSGMVRANFVDDMNKWFITGAYTTGDSRGKVFPRKILSELGQEIKRRGGNEVFIAVKRNNERALRLYQALGFKAAPNTISDKIKRPVSNYKWVTMKIDL